MFKKDNPSWPKIKVVITDKDMSQRKWFKLAFENVDLQLCLFHVLRNFNREISCAKHSLSQQERNSILGYVQALVYARNESDYQQKKNNCFLIIAHQKVLKTIF